MDARTEPRVEGPSRRDRPRDTEPDKPRVSIGARLRQHPYLAAGAAIALVLLLAGGVLWWLHARQYESTDDAFIDARSITIAVQLTGTIIEVPVTDNETV